MNKKELIKATAERANYSERATAELLDHLLDEIMHQVANGEKVLLTGFGSFEPVFKEAHTARNPKTGEPVEVPEHYAPKFKAGATFKGAVKS